MAVLEPLIAEAPRARPFEFFSGVLGKARLRFVSRLGSEANDVIDALLDRALDYEEAHGTSLAGFVNWFQAGEIEIKRNMEQGLGEVRDDGAWRQGPRGAHRLPAGYDEAS